MGSTVSRFDMPGSSSSTVTVAFFCFMFQPTWSVATVCSTPLSSACHITSIWSASRSGGQPT